jgi:hypothetical protein
MTFPSILFAAAVALLVGALYHFLRDGGGWRLLLYLGVSILGFAGGQLVGAWRGWHFFMFGPLNLGMGIAGSIVFLIGSEWLGRIDASRKSSV